MLKKILASTLAVSLMVGVAACGAMNQPVGPINPVVDQNIETTFASLEAGLAALSLVPNLPPAVAKEANATLAALQAAYTQYKANPTATTYQAALQAAVAAATKFMASQAHAKALVAPVAAQ